MKIKELNQVKKSFRTVVEENVWPGQQVTTEFKKLLDGIFSNLDYEKKAELILDKLDQIEFSATNDNSRELHSDEELFVKTVRNGLEK